MRSSLIESTTQAIDGRAAIREALSGSPSASAPLSSPFEALPTSPKTITTPGANTLDQLPEVIAWDDGFLAVWNRSASSGGSSVLAQKFDANGNADGGIMTIQAAATNVIGKAELVDLGAGKVGVFWQVGTELKGAFLNPATGAVTGTKTIVTSPADWMHDVVRLANGDIAMATTQYDGAKADVNLVILNDANLATIATRTAGTFSAPSNTYDHTITTLGNGGVMLYRNRDTNQLFAQKFNAAGGFVGAADKINTTAISLPTSFDGTYFKPQAVELEGGGYAAVWVNVEGSGGDRVEVRARVFDASGAPVAKDFLVNASPTGNQYNPQVLALEDGRFAVLWVSDVGFVRQTMIKYFDSEGKALTGDLVAGTPSIFTTTVDHQAVVLADGMIADVYPEGGYTALTVDGIRQPTFGSAAADTLPGTAGDDIIIANEGNDTINVKQGGNDVVNGGAGADIFDFGAAYTTADYVDGGAQNDVVKLDGDYANLSFANNLINVETLLLAAGHDYQLILNNAMAAEGKSFTVDGSGLGAADNLVVYGTAETDGSLVLLGGAGNDTLFDGTRNDVLRGGAGNDVINIAMSGDDAVRGDDGNDTIQATAYLNDKDQIEGGRGTDTLVLAGNYSAGLVFKASTVTQVEKIALSAGYNYSLSLNNGNVDLAQVMTIDGSALSASNWMRIDGSAETNGRLVLLGGAGNDTLIGGRGADVLSGGEGMNTYDTSAGGADVITGGSADETINAGAAFNAKSKIDGGAGVDTLVLNGEYDDLTFKSKTLKDIERIELKAGHDYHLTMDGANIGTGQSMFVHAIGLASANELFFDARAETTGSYVIEGGFGDDTLKGGAGDDELNGNWSTLDFSGDHAPSFGDVIDLSRGGTDFARCYDSATFIFGGALDAGDRISAGSDVYDWGVVILDGKYDTRVTMESGGMSYIDEIRLGKGHDYNIDFYVGGQSVLLVDGSKLSNKDQLDISVEGANLTKAVVLGGAAADTLVGSHAGDSIVGGAGHDKLTGGDGFDTLTGGAGSDTFIAVGSGYDLVTDLSKNADWLDLRAIDAKSTVAGDDAFILIGASDFTGVAGQLQVKYGGETTMVQGDTDGDGVADLILFVLAGDQTGFDNFML
jgi:Ca2+-binding RTX toxin-like protein